MQSYVRFSNAIKKPLCFVRILITEIKLVGDFSLFSCNEKNSEFLSKLGVNWSC